VIPTVLVWVYFWGKRQTNTYLIDKDFESKKHKYSAKSYLKVLDTEVEPNYPGREYIFMQDNTSIYTAKIVKDWFRIRKIKIFD
jgi:hypothetical protein